MPIFLDKIINLKDAVDSYATLEPTYTREEQIEAYALATFMTSWAIKRNTKSPVLLLACVIVARELANDAIDELSKGDLQ